VIGRALLAGAGRARTAHAAEHASSGRCRAACGAIVAIALLASLSNCATTTRSHASDEAAIASFNARYLKAINDGDFATLSSLTTEDHIMLAPNRPALIGKRANDEANRHVSETFNIVETWAPLETVISGDVAYQRGTFTVAATPKAGGNTNRISGNFLRIYRRQPDGTWNMTVDMFNSDQPARSVQ
jgi:ketosteroid isomerase-like protein